MTLDTLKYYFGWLGILSFDSQPRNILFASILQWIYCGMFALYVLTTSWFFVFDAVTFQDYSRSFFFVSIATLSTIWYVIHVVRRNEYADIFQDFEHIIGTSENIFCTKNSFKPNDTYSRSLFIYIGKRWDSKTRARYRCSNDRIKKLIQISHLLSMRMVGVFVLCSPIFVSFWKYFTSGYSNDSFELLIPAL